MCANKFLAQKVFVVRPGTEIDLGYFLENWPEVKILKPFAGQMVIRVCGSREYVTLNGLFDRSQSGQLNDINLAKVSNEVTSYT